MTVAAPVRLKANPILGNPPTLEWKAVGELGVDPVYQRSTAMEASQSLIRRIAIAWDWGLCQPLAVAKRANGELMVVDGQHRLEAARLRGDIPHLPCVIASYATEGDEAAAFVALNQRRRPLSKLDLFKAALAAEDPTAKEIARAMTANGLSLAPHMNYISWKPGMVSNIAGIQTLWQEKGERFTETALYVLAQAFAGKVLRYAGTLLPGIAAFIALSNLNAREDIDRLVKALGRKDQDAWRKAIAQETANSGARRELAGRHVFTAAYLGEQDIEAAPPKSVDDQLDEFLRKPLVEVETQFDADNKQWCDQCDARVSAAKAATCASAFCRLKRKAA